MRISLLLPLLVTVLFASGLPAQEYKTVREAKAAAGPHLRSMNYAAAQAPLEAALKLTPESDTKERIDLYRALMACYRLLPEPDKMIEAVEYILQHSPSKTERSLIARNFTSFMHQRGKTDASIARYEEKLKANAKDPSALVILTKTYLYVKNDKTRGGKLEADLKQLDVERATAEAERMAKEADAQADAAALNWLNVAKMWLDAENKEQAKAAAARSLKAMPESRTGILTMQWRESLGDVLMEVGDREEAVRQYMQALEKASADILKKNIQKKLDKAKLKST
jgi:tetratricopeptide (TPR) repeat protein